MSLSINLDSTSAILVSLAITALLFRLLRPVQAAEARGKRLPGPWQVPGIGRVHDLPLQQVWLKFTEWGKEYGQGIYTTNMGPQTMVIVTDQAIAEELLVRRAKKYSDRPRFVSLFDSKNGNFLPLMGNHEKWSRHRRWLAAAMRQRFDAGFDGLIERETRQWLSEILHQPDQDPSAGIEALCSRVSTSISWGDSSDNEENVYHATGLIKHMSPSYQLSNRLTFLWDLPLCMNPWKRFEVQRSARHLSFWSDKLESSRNKEGCLSHQYSQGKDRGFTADVDEKEASGMVGTIAHIAVITTGGPLHFFIVAMLLHPQWQEKIEREVTAVCGDKMPTLQDVWNLPILRACVKETMRWRPVVPTGVAHEVTENDIYNGYRIAKGSYVLPVDWAMTRDPVKYPDGEAFRPERWLEPDWPTYAPYNGSDSASEDPLSISSLTAFGFGRRVCIGASMAQAELLVMCGALLWAFKIEHQVDKQTGQKIEVNPDKTTSFLIIKPEPFRLHFEPRSEMRNREVLG